MQTHLMSNKLSSDLTDDILVQQAHHGDQGAFEMLVDRYSALLLRLICRMVPELRTGVTLKGWLCQVARHRCIDELRELLLGAIETLPSRYRTVVLLRYGTQLSFREIGQELGIPAATAKTYFYRAKELLRTLLEPEFADGRDIGETASVATSSMCKSRAVSSRGSGCRHQEAASLAEAGSATA